MREETPQARTSRREDRGQTDNSHDSADSCSSDVEYWHDIDDKAKFLMRQERVENEEAERGDSHDEAAAIHSHTERYEKETASHCSW